MKNGIPRIGRSRGWLLLAGSALLVVLVLALARDGLSPAAGTTAGELAGTRARGSDPATPSPTRTATRSSAGLAIPTPLPGDRLPTVQVDRLPSQARDVMRLIAAGGPFPYRQDGTVFQNREGLLPAKPSGYYREYTVETPGSPDRGVRRIVAGQQGELYYTDDHYASFRRVIP